MAKFQRHHPINSDSKPDIKKAVPENNNGQNSLDIAFYASLFGIVPDPVLIVDDRYGIEYANPAALNFFNFKDKKPAGSSIKDFFAGDSFNKLSAIVPKIFKDFRQMRMELNVLNGEGENIISDVTIVPIVRDKKIARLRITLHDISQERQIEEIIRESQKMEALQYFVSGTAKELKYPLMAILKRIESIEERYQGRSFEYVSYKEFNGIIDFLAFMHKQIKHCYDTTSKLTNLSKKRLKFENKSCQANAIIRELMRLKGSYLESVNIKYRLKLTENLPAVALGEIELNQILSSIIENAIQAMPAGGNLLINTSLLKESNRIKIDVIDDGVGIPPEDLPHIFEPFFTTKHRGAQHNAGLGLTIVYSLVKAAQGQIHVKSSLRRGTSVYVTFPALSDVGDKI